ncbi:unnamed protein product [Ceutorhynchus assimilis]|uniref:Phospholipase A2-like central domain-containing protein n=1 Tax=Ceutorhynchus assimilis TaxID=467358 RepID=A0A9P0GQU4_9CUCU|nr:unnamed protein product [Ceutorhynchus assimilis]
MFLKLYYAHFYYLSVVVAGESKFQSRSDDFEESLPLIFPQIFIQPFVNNSKISPQKYYNFTKQTSKTNAPYGYLKGYSLKIPKLKLFEKGPSPDMKLIEQEARTKRGEDLHLKLLFQIKLYTIGVPHLYNMISCATGCNPLKYKGYGCFCGLFGSGIPVDGIDRCCKSHDFCYEIANCPMLLEYFIPYYWKCWYNRPYCAVDHGEYGRSGSCADMLCQCDRALAECLQRYSCPSRSQRAFCKSSPFSRYLNMPQSSTQKLRVLALHGYTQSAGKFREKLPLQRKFKKLADFVFITAPFATPLIDHDIPDTLLNGNQIEPREPNLQKHPITDANGAFEIEEEPVQPEDYPTNDTDSFAWYLRRPNKTNTGHYYRGIRECISFLEKVFEEQGPFDVTKNIKFDFAIVAGGFKFPIDNFYDEKLHVSSLHIYGETDQRVVPERSELVASFFENPTVVSHAGGHFVPCNASQKLQYEPFFIEQWNKKFGGESIKN